LAQHRFVLDVPAEIAGEIVALVPLCHRLDDER
jgi:hypothetical protein